MNNRRNVDAKAKADAKTDRTVDKSGQTIYFRLYINKSVSELAKQSVSLGE